MFLSVSLTQNEQHLASPQEKSANPQVHDDFDWISYTYFIYGVDTTH
jgi:hypothetical protein